MRVVHEIVIVVMEILGMLFVSAGLGCVAAWEFGVAGQLTVTGLCLLGFATLTAIRQRSMLAPPKPDGRR